MPKLTRKPGGYLTHGRQTPFILPSFPYHLRHQDFYQLDAIFQFLYKGSLFKGVSCDNPLLVYFERCVAVAEHHLRQCDGYLEHKAHLEYIKKCVRTQRWHLAMDCLYGLYKAMNHKIITDQVPMIVTSIYKDRSVCAYYRSTA